MICKRPEGLLLRRLLVAAMACVVVWKLQADDSPKAVELKNVLVRLSGRLTGAVGHPHTTPALLAGLWVLLSMVSILEDYPLHELKQLAAKNPLARHRIKRCVETNARKGRGGKSCSLTPPEKQRSRVHIFSPLPLRERGRG